MSNEQWYRDFLGAFEFTQADYFTALQQIGFEDPGATGDDAPLEYMDYFGCSTLQANDFACKAW